MDKAGKRRRIKPTTVGIVVPLIVIWVTGAYSLFRAVEIEQQPMALRAWVVGILLIGCSTATGLQLRRPLSIESRVADLERLAASEQWGCTAEEGVQAVVTALHNTNNQHRNQPRVVRRDVAKQ